MSELDYLDTVDDRREGARVFKILGRRKLAFFLPFYGLLALVALAVTVVTPKYQSKGTIEVQRKAVNSAATANEIDERLVRVQQTIQTNAVVEEIIRKYNVYGDDFTEADKQKIMDRFRDSMSIERVDAEVVDTRTGRESATTVAFDVKFRDADPEMAHQVTEELVDRVMVLSEESRRRSSEATAEVLAQNAERAETVAGDIEAKLAEFRRVNAGKLPEQSASNLQTVQSTQAQLLSVDSEVRSLQQEQAFAEAELATTDKYSGLVTSTGERVMNDSENLRLLKVQLAEARRKYSAEHPDIRRLERQLREAQATAGTSAPVLPERANNPAYITLRSKLRSIEARLGSLQTSRGELRNKLSRLERLSVGTPAIEKQYLALERDYNEAVRNLNDARQKVANAELNVAIGDSETGDRLSLIEKPVVPVEPDKPIRLSIGVLGTLLAVFVGLAIAVLVDLMDRTVRDVSDLLKIMNEPPLGVIGKIDSAADVFSRNMGTLLIVVVPCLIAAFLFLRLA
mgnify:CR=1 FL=1